jgi:hypothetical protein
MARPPSKTGANTARPATDRNRWHDPEKAIWIAIHLAIQITGSSSFTYALTCAMRDSWIRV